MNSPAAAAIQRSAPAFFFPPSFKGKGAMNMFLGGAKRDMKWRINWILCEPLVLAAGPVL